MVGVQGLESLVRHALHVLAVLAVELRDQRIDQLAQVAPSTDPAKPVVAASDTGSTNVAVSTGQGILIRDARLEQMLAEHRQYGGMSALQMPAGFLRNATYDTAPQR